MLGQGSKCIAVREPEVDSHNAEYLFVGLRRRKKKNKNKNKKKMMVMMTKKKLCIPERALPLPPPALPPSFDYRA
jgi:hypothetical protein